MAAALAAILPLSLAAGIDLYLTLVLIGSAGLLGWDPGPPGALADLAHPWIVLAAALFYLLEFWAERAPHVSLFWNAVHGTVRPLAGVLLGLLLLEGQPLPAQLAGIVVAGVVAGLAQAARTGWSFLLWIVRAKSPSRLLVTAAEDAGVLALVSLLLDHPFAGAALALLAILLGGIWTGPCLRAFLFQVRIMWARTWGSLSPKRWRDPGSFPSWVSRALRDHRLAPGGVLRGAPAGAVAVPGLGSFRSGWVVVRGGTPLFLYRRVRGVGSVDLGGGHPLRVVDESLTNRVELQAPGGGVYALYFTKDGPRVEGLEVEFLG